MATMINARIRTAGLAIVAVYLFPIRVAIAQVIGYPDSSFNCGEILRQAAVDPRATVFEGRIGACGGAGLAIIASTVERSADVPDTSYFSHLINHVPRGGSMLAAAIRLASNTNATRAARIGGLRLLAVQLMGQGADLITPAGLGNLQATDYCVVNKIGAGDASVPEDDPLPADYRAQIQATSERILNEPSVDVAVRRAAFCVRRTFGSLPPRPVDPSTIRLTNVCETRFRVTNSGDGPVILWFDVAGKRGQTKIGAPVGDSFIVGRYAGFVRLFDGNRLLASANSSETRCPVRPAKPD